MTAGIYEIKNLVENQSYIGRSMNIENRWVGHKSSPTGNMAPTIELYNENPELVEWNIILKIEEGIFDKEELQFILSMCELHEVEKRGGWDSESLINGRDIDIKPCPPYILKKRDKIPSFIDDSDLIYGFDKWFHEYHYGDPSSHFDSFLKEQEANKKAYEQIEALSAINSSLHEKISELEEKNHYRKKMETDYEYFKLKKDNSFLKDKNEELKAKVSFWKEKAHFWRDKCFGKEEAVLFIKQKQEILIQIESVCSNYGHCDIGMLALKTGFDSETINKAISQLMHVGKIYQPSKGVLKSTV